MLPDNPGAARGLAIVHSSYLRAYPRDAAFRKYLDTMADDLKFRECFVAEHPRLDHSLCCPHLTKPVFAIWLLAAEGRALTADQLRLRLRGFLIELFHRAKVGFAWEPARFSRQLDEIFGSRVPPEVLSDPLSMGSTRVQAAAKAIPVLLDPFRFVTLPPDSVLERPRLDTEAVYGFRHYQFTYQYSLGVFRGLGVASSCEDFEAQNSILDLARQLQVSRTSNNLERNSVDYYALPMTEVSFAMPTCSPLALLDGSLSEQDVFYFEGYKQGFAALKCEAALRVGNMFSEAYIRANVKSHCGPVTRLDLSHVREWSAQRGLDAAKALDLDNKGLSRTACLCSSCPYYLKVLGPSNRPGKVSPALKAHLEGVPAVPGLHKAIYERFPRQPSEDLEAYVARVSELLRSCKHLDLAYPDVANLKKTRRPRGCVYPRKLSAEEIAERILKYSEDLKGRIHCNFGAPGELEGAVRAVLSMPVLSRAETFEALDRAFPETC